MTRETYRSEREYALDYPEVPERYEHPARASVRFIGCVIAACVAMWVVAGFLFARSRGWI